jgi:hypothetical protein
MPVWVEKVVIWVGLRCVPWLIVGVVCMGLALHVVWFFVYWGQYVWLRSWRRSDRVPSQPRWLDRSLRASWKAGVWVIAITVVVSLFAVVAARARLARLGTEGIRTVELTYDGERTVLAGDEALQLYRRITKSPPVMAHHSHPERGLRLRFNGDPGYEYELSLDSAVPTELWLEDISYPRWPEGFRVRQFRSAEVADFVRATLASKRQKPGGDVDPE